ncbi:acylphosphatase [Marinospirillum perlucidum]|uniref:acylphosphatase n=1 Tax=Marinospirillum perlucidum TaxID=1982602 RepID=UPI000DF27B91|nr:acylphosphatase [Marinospirillum perlucidum]
MQKSCRLFKVSGRVQGVWYRKSTQKQAEAKGVSGWAVNLADGGVEVCLAGPEEAVAEVADWLAQGPEMARVDLVEELPAPDAFPEQGFTTG